MVTGIRGWGGLTAAIGWPGRIALPSSHTTGRAVHASGGFGNQCGLSQRESAGGLDGVTLPDAELETLVQIYPVFDGLIPPDTSRHRSCPSADLPSVGRSTDLHDFSCSQSGGCALPGAHEKAPAGRPGLGKREGVTSRESWR